MEWEAASLPTCPLLRKKTEHADGKRRAGQSMGCLTTVIWREKTPIRIWEGLYIYHCMEIQPKQLVDFDQDYMSNRHSVTLSLLDDHRPLVLSWNKDHYRISWTFFSGTLFEIGDTKTVYKYRFYPKYLICKPFQEDFFSVYSVIKVFVLNCSGGTYWASIQINTSMNSMLSTS